MDDYRNYAGAQLGAAGINQPVPKSGELVEINERLSYISKRASELAMRVGAMGDRVFGCQPECENLCEMPVRNSGEAGAIHATIDQIEISLSAAEREADRISHL